MGRGEERREREGGGMEMELKQTDRKSGYK